MADRDSSSWTLGDLFAFQEEPARGARRDAEGTREVTDDPLFTWGFRDLLDVDQAYLYELAEGSKKSHWDASSSEGVAYNSYDATSNYENSAVDSEDEGKPELSEDFHSYASEKINIVVMPEFEGLLPLLKGTTIQDHASSLLELCSVMQDKLSRPFPFHPTKCRCLARSYFLCVKLVLTSLHTIPSSPLDPLCFKKLNAPLEALNHAIREGDSFLVDCESPPTQVDKALCLALSTDIVDHHLHDLIWCMSVLFQALDFLPGPHFMSQEAWQAEQMHGFLKEIWGHVDEKQDIRSIKMFLAKVGAEEKGEVRDGVNFISRRLSVGGSEGNSDDVLPSYLWVDPKDFPEGGVCIGKGSYGVVLKTRWMGGRFASKIFLPMEGDTLFVREAVIHAKLRHSNVVHMVCCTKSASMSNQCILVMELMHKDLRKLIIERFNSGVHPPFPLLAAVDIMLQIAKGMEYLHGLRIMHRDLRADNILISRLSTDSKGHVRVKIGDFGISKVKQSSSMYSTKDIGTTAWRAPEVFGIDGEPAITKYSNKADVYSFAMVCYELLTGKEPFSDPYCKRRDIYQKVKDGHRPKLPQYCPAALASYIEKCWHGNPLKRPPFKQICIVLRYFKSCILCGDLESLASPLQDDENMCDLHKTVDEGIYHPVLNMMFEMYDCRLRMISSHQGMEGSAQRH